MLNRTRRRLGIKPKRLAVGLWHRAIPQRARWPADRPHIPVPDMRQRAEGAVWSTRRVPPRRHPARSEDAADRRERTAPK